MAESTPSAAQDRCECGADPGDINFDRSICACGSMHYFCNQCGTQAEPCSDDPTAATPSRIESLRGTLRIAQLDSRDDTNPTWDDFDQALATVDALADGEPSMEELDERGH